jgi:transposase
VSWLRLEQFAQGALDRRTSAVVAAHLASCAACAGCLAAIRADAPALPPLPVGVVAPAARPAWRWWLGGGALALAAAAIALAVLPGRDDARPPGRPAQVAIKGAGVVVVSTVRDRAGAITFDPSGFRTTDRWKLRITCAPGAALWVDVVVRTTGEAPAFPLAAQRIACGNQVALDGAFRLTTAAPTALCVALTIAGPADRAALVRDPDTAPLACVQVAPEP